MDNSVCVPPTFPQMLIIVNKMKNRFKHMHSNMNLRNLPAKDFVEKRHNALINYHYLYKCHTMILSIVENFFLNKVFNTDATDAQVPYLASHSWILQEQHHSEMHCTRTS